MSRLLPALVLTVAAGLPVPAGAQTTSFRELPLVVNLDDTVIVRDVAGEQIRGRVTGLGPSELVLVVGSDREDRLVRLGPDDVSEVIRMGDPVRNGAAMGFCVGAGLGLAGWAVEWRHRGKDLPFGYMIMLGGVGAAVGVAADALVDAEVVVFRRAGAVVSLSASPSISIRW